ncbi:hypothetical protein QWY84_12160 [Aquisalimonas lutea]|uniref:hypothetical protein n=1 Tax=Aquisalimonas lutea TaxID=1327750 RepID=UPI0025B52CA6|nr:hypothetical protein [Aquisalimonas lutea]MDN3518366.1 hypothetical protein [Aquisalimonas lutea]
MTGFDCGAMMVRAVALVFAAALVTGCAGTDGAPQAESRPPREPAPEPPGVAMTVYDCADGSRVVVEGQGRASVRLHREGESRRLTRDGSGQALSYSDGRVGWEVANGRGTYTHGSGTRTRCGETPGVGAWEAARLDGVTYRATARDGSWLLEVREEVLVFRRRGDDPVRADSPTWMTGRRLEAEREGETVHLERLEGACRRGDAQPLLEPVRIRIGQRRFEGCGRRLET